MNKTSAIKRNTGTLYALLAKTRERIKDHARPLCTFLGESGHRANFRRDSGQAIVETAISLVVTITLAFWLFELSMMTYTCIVLNDAVHEGVRYATLHGTDSTTCSGPDAACSDKSPYASVQTAVRGVTAISLHNMTGMNIKVSYPDATAKPGNRVSVSVEYTYAPYINFPGLKTFLIFSSQGRITY